jgi:DNA-binding HxlR family transcriptional regulator
MAKRRFTPCIEGCPVEVTLNVIGGKWKGVVLYHLFKQNVLRFGELRKMMTGVTQRMLTTQLRELERDGLVCRTVFPEVPPKVEYSLSFKGETLREIIRSLERWGVEHRGD